jgi:hypothetical protein
MLLRLRQKTAELPDFPQLGYFVCMVQLFCVSMPQYILVTHQINRHQPVVDRPT